MSKLLKRSLVVVLSTLLLISVGFFLSTNTAKANSTEITSLNQVTSLSMSKGASIKAGTTQKDTGMKFEMTISQSEFNALSQLGTVKYGMVIAPSNYVDANHEFTVANIFEDGACYWWDNGNLITGSDVAPDGKNPVLGNTLAKVNAKIWQITPTKDTVGSNYNFIGAVLNFPADNEGLLRDYVCCGYISLTVDGKTEYLMADYYNGNKSNNVRSMYFVAQKGIAEGQDAENKFGGKLKEYYVNPVSFYGFNEIDLTSNPINIDKAITDSYDVNLPNTVGKVVRLDFDGVSYDYSNGIENSKEGVMVLSSSLVDKFALGDNTLELYTVKNNKYTVTVSVSQDKMFEGATYQFEDPNSQDFKLIKLVGDASYQNGTIRFPADEGKGGYVVDFNTETQNSGLVIKFNHLSVSEYASIKLNARLVGSDNALRILVNDTYFEVAITSQTYIDYELINGIIAKGITHIDTISIMNASSNGANRRARINYFTFTTLFDAATYQFADKNASEFKLVELVGSASYQEGNPALYLVDGKDDGAKGRYVVDFNTTTLNSGLVIKFNHLPVSEYASIKLNARLVGNDNGLRILVNGIYFEVAITSQTYTDYELIDGIIANGITHIDTISIMNGSSNGANRRARLNYFTFTEGTYVPAEFIGATYQFEDSTSPDFKLVKLQKDAAYRTAGIAYTEDASAKGGYVVDFNTYVEGGGLKVRFNKLKVADYTSIKINARLVSGSGGMRFYVNDTYIDIGIGSGNETYKDYELLDAIKAKGITEINSISILRGLDGYGRVRLNYFTFA